MKKCTNCGEEKSLEHFHKNASSPDGHQKWCKSCRSGYNHKNTHYQREYQRKYRGDNIAELRDQRRQTKYGVEAGFFSRLLVIQDHKCAICSEPVNESSALDHCHTTGKVRGILCTLCNTALGKFRDNPDNLMSAIRYLEKHTQDSLKVA